MYEEPQARLYEMWLLYRNGGMSPFSSGDFYEPTRSMDMYAPGAARLYGFLKSVGDPDILMEEIVVKKRGEDYDYLRQLGAQKGIDFDLHMGRETTDSAIRNTVSRLH